MNKTLILLLLIAGRLCANAQTVNDVPLNKIDSVASEYVMITVQEKLFKIELIVDIDYGQKTHITRVVDENGRNYTFYSRVEILNIMDNLGYELVTAELIPASGDVQPISYFIMRRKRTVN